jgi:hypothetical protein
MAYTATFDAENGVGYINIIADDGTTVGIERTEMRTASIAYDYDGNGLLVGIEIVVDGDEFRNTGVSIETPPQYGHGE